MATRTTLNVSLPVELGSFIAAKIASGRYASASEVAGLRLLEPSEALSITARRRKRRESQVDLLRHLADIGTRKYVRCHRAYEEPYMVQLVPTGIRGLDEILLGGIIHNNTVLVKGIAGSGKTLLGIQFVYNGAVRFHEPALS